MKRLDKYITIVILFFIFSCGDIDISESWAKNKFIEETGLTSGVTIDSVKRYAGQACVYASITNEAREGLEKRFKFVSNEEFLGIYNGKNSPAYIPFPKQLFNLDSTTNSTSSITDDRMYYLKTYTNKTGMIATSYYVIMLLKKENKIIFTEAFDDL